MDGAEMNALIFRWFLGALLGFGVAVQAQPLQPGDAIRLTLRGVPAEEQQKISGEYTVGDDGMVSMPLLDDLVRAAGLTPGGFARSLEKKYKTEGIYAAPAIDVVAKKDEKAGGAVISVGGHVKRSGHVPFRQGMTVVQAINAAGGRDQFGGRNIELIRAGKQYVLDYKQLRHKNVVLRADDALMVAMRPAIIDRWKGDPERVKGLLAN
ncbi:MAG: polysaccharide biosynthesis/export family protein [Verrucomicrobiota bacterium]